MLRSAKIKQVFTTELVRTRQTAAPTAAEAHVEPIVVPSKDLDDLVGRITRKAPTLVVGHSNTVPDILKKLGVSESVLMSAIRISMTSSSWFGVRETLSRS